MARALILFFCFQLSFALQIEISSKQFYANENELKSEFYGDVVVKSGTDELRSDRAVVFFSKKREPIRYEAIGNAKFKASIKEKKYSGSGDKLVYDVAKQTYIITGNAHLKEDESGSFAKYPDLILIDGGKGHISAVKKVLCEENVDLPVFGMVKDDFHKTRALCTDTEEINIAKERSVFMIFVLLLCKSGELRIIRTRVCGVVFVHTVPFDIVIERPCTSHDLRIFHQRFVSRAEHQEIFREFAFDPRRVGIDENRTVQTGKKRRAAADQGRIDFRYGQHAEISVVSGGAVAVRLRHRIERIGGLVLPPVPVA